MADDWLQLDCDRPAWLLTMLVIPLLYLVYRRSLANLPVRQLTASLATRSIIVLLLSLALSGLTWLTESRQVYVVFAVDESASISDTSGSAAEQFIRQATDGVANSRYSVMTFADQPRVLKLQDCPLLKIRCGND